VLAPVAGDLGSRIWGLLVLVVAVFGFLMQLSEVKLCFGRLEKLAHAGPPMPLSGSGRITMRCSGRGKARMEPRR